jgi:hypothetical protein
MLQFSSSLLSPESCLVAIVIHFSSDDVEARSYLGVKLYVPTLELFRIT